MNKTRIGILALGMFAIGSIGSIAVQAFAQGDSRSPLTASSTVQSNQTLDKVDTTGDDLETQDDAAVSATSTPSLMNEGKGDKNENGDVSGESDSNDNPGASDNGDTGADD